MLADQSAEDTAKWFACHADIEAGVAWWWISTRSGILSTQKSSALKKTLHAAEQDRPDVARRRAQWRRYQGRIDPSRLVFIDG